jgi:adenylate cyclase
MDFFKFDKNKLIGFLISIIIMAIVAGIYSQTILMDGMEFGAYNQRFILRDPSEKEKKLSDAAKFIKMNPRARKDIIILGIDENTIRDFAEKGKQWPFKWDDHAKFTNYISSGKPKGILFDIMFIDPRKKEEKNTEKIFAEAIKKAGNVYLDFPFEVSTQDKQYADMTERLYQMGKVKFPINSDDNMPQWVEEALPPLPILGRETKGIGFANVRSDSDKTNRKMPLVIKYKNNYYPNIDLIILMDFYGISVNDVEIKMGDYIKLKNIPKEKMAKPIGESLLQTITIPVDKEGFMDINFIGGPGSFLHYSYNLFYRDGTMANNDSLKDKLLLIAAYSVTGIATDVHKSPYGETFGIEHHANALNTIMSQDFIIKLNEWQNILILLILGIILGFLLPRVSIVISVIITIGVILIYSVISYLVFDNYNIITIFAAPILQTFVTFSLIIAYRVVTEQKEKKYIRSTFSKFVSKSVVDDLLKHPDKLKLGGEKKVLTVLFSDIRGFTTISETYGNPQLLVAHLNEYLQSMTDIVFKFNGTLDKYVGDEIMAFWGAPIELENHALDACKAALQMGIDLEILNQNWIAQGRPILKIGIGLNSGEMVVGNMGSSSRMDYTLMGDNVNLGARLEGTNKVYGTLIIISEYTYELVKDNVIVRELDLIKVKGKSKPVKIFELIDVK